jgi:peptidoglycan/LPS O-acetylase OafA/YrhL
MEWLADRFELARGGGKHHVLSMEGLRGFAVFLVFLVHYVSLITPWLTANAGIGQTAAAIHSIGNAGVDLFFVLSGYLIYGSLIRRKTPFLPYFRQRLIRIYPAFSVVFVTYVALSFAVPAQSKLPPGAYQTGVYLIENFLLLPGLFPIEAMITVAWSLSYEMFYYLVLPPIVLAFGLRERQRRWRVAFFIAIACALVVYCAIAGGPIRLVMFIAGILLYEALSDGRWPAPPSAITAGILIAGLGLMLVHFPGTMGTMAHSLILAVTFSILCYSCFKDVHKPVTSWFCWTPMRWLGNMSYSYYLLHGLALKAGFTVLQKFVPATTSETSFFFAMLIPMFVLTLIPTTVLFLFVERPFSLAPRKSPAKIAETEAAVPSR